MYFYMLSTNMNHFVSDIILIIVILWDTADVFLLTYFMGINGKFVGKLFFFINGRGYFYLPEKKSARCAISDTPPYK